MVEEPRRDDGRSTPDTLRNLLILLGAAAGLAVASPSAAAEFRITAPSAPGTGWDQLAHALRDALGDERGEIRIEVQNVPGSGGTAGLVRFAAEAGSEDLLVTGLTMVDAALVQRSPVELERMTPVARLAAEPFAVAVPAASPLATIGDLQAAMGAEPGKVTWAGGPVGGIDHVALILFARAIGADPMRLTFVPFLTSAEAAAAAAAAAPDAQLSAVIVPAGEAAAEARAGRLRVLGVTAPGRVDTVDAPTLQEMGIPFEFSNWRGLVGRPELTEEQRGSLLARAATLAGSRHWKELLVRRGWQNAYLSAEAFGDFIRSEAARIKVALKAAGLLKRPAE